MRREENTVLKQPGGGMLCAPYSKNSMSRDQEKSATIAPTDIVYADRRKRTGKEIHAN
jgi:hypothetical protein